MSFQVSQRDPSAFARDDGVSQARLERPAKILEAIESFLDYIDAGGVAEPNGAIVAEGSPRHDRDIRFTQQAVSKVLRGQSELADIHQHVKGALRFDRGHVRNLRNPIKHVVAAHIEFIAHVRDRLLIALEGRERATLREGAWVRRAMTLNGIDCFRHWLRRRQITKPPARHGI
jgi:hypothetical protein